MKFRAIPRSIPIIRAVIMFKFNTLRVVITATRGSAESSGLGSVDSSTSRIFASLCYRKNF